MKFKVRTSKVLRLEHGIYVAETWALRKVNEKQLKVFQMCCREWRSDGPIASKVKKCYTELRRKGTFFI